MVIQLKQRKTGTIFGGRNCQKGLDMFDCTKLKEDGIAGDCGVRRKKYKNLAIKGILIWEIL